MRISPNRIRASDGIPLVTVSAAGKYQLRIAFNAALMRKMDLRSDTIAIDWDKDNNRLTFITDTGDSYGGGWTFPLGYDGDKTRHISRVLYISAKRCPFLTLGKYIPEFGTVIGGDDDPVFWPGDVSYAHPTINITTTSVIEPDNIDRGADD